MKIREYQYKQDEVLSLYRSVGWTAYTRNPVVLQKGFKNSLLILGAFDADKLIGLIRPVGDGETILFIQDLLIRPEWQRKGIGSQLLQAVFERYSHVRQIELLTDDANETRAFYQANGMQEAKSLGCCCMIKTS